MLLFCFVIETFCLLQAKLDFMSCIFIICPDLFLNIFLMAPPPTHDGYVDPSTRPLQRFVFLWHLWCFCGQRLVSVTVICLNALVLLCD